MKMNTLHVIFFGAADILCDYILVKSSHWISFLR